MSKFILNIGLNVGYIEPKTQLDSTMFHVEQLLPNSTFTVKDNLGGDWGKERIVIVEGTTDHVYSSTRLLQELCWRLRQNAISYSITKGDMVAKGLVFNTDYEGERYEYNEAYFVRE